MKEIIFSKHALLKIEILRAHGIIIDQEFVRKALTHPNKIERGYKGRFIAQKKLDDDHVLRTVYEENDEHILVITLYPGRSERYEKD
jgi:hypothetical protein